MIIEKEIKKIITNKEQALNRYSERAQIAMKFEIKILNESLQYIKQLEKIIAEKNQYIEDLKKYNGDLFFENWKLQEEVEHGRFYTEDNIMLKDSMRSNLELLHINANLTAQIEELKIHIRSLLYEGKQYDNVGG